MSVHNDVGAGKEGLFAMWPQTITFERSCSILMGFLFSNSHSTDFHTDWSNLLLFFSILIQWRHDHRAGLQHWLSLLRPTPPSTMTIFLLTVCRLPPLTKRLPSDWSFRTKSRELAMLCLKPAQSSRLSFSAPWSFCRIRPCVYVKAVVWTAHLPNSFLFASIPTSLDSMPSIISAWRPASP